METSAVTLNIAHDKYITLFPLRLEIRYINNRNSSEQYRIRWYPDEISLAIPGKAISPEEQNALDYFIKIYTHLKTNSPFDYNPTHDEILKIYNHLKSGVLTNEQKQVCEEYNRTTLEQILSNYNQYKENHPDSTLEMLCQQGIGLRMGWEVYDLENPVLAMAWQRLVDELGVIRARYLVGQFLNNSLPKSNNGFVCDPIDHLSTHGIYVGLLPSKIYLFTVKFDAQNKPLSEKLAEVDIPDAKKLFLYHHADSSTDWSTDFKQALEKHMAIVIEDTTRINQINNADWLLVFGVSDESIKFNNNDLEKIFMHLRAHNKLAIALQDTPTNNTEQDDTAYKNLETDLAKYIEKTKMQNNMTYSENLFNIIWNYHIALTDAQLLSYILEIDASLLSEIPGADAKEQMDAEFMARLLWPICTRCYKEEWGSEENILAIENFFIKLVRAGGTLPVIQAGHNPYGILPIANFHKDFNWTDSTIQCITKYIMTLATHFKTLSNNIPTLSQHSDYETLLEILRLTSTSQRVDVRKLNNNSHEFDTDSEYLLGPLVSEEENGINYLRAIADGQLDDNHKLTIDSCVLERPENMLSNNKFSLLHRLLSLYVYHGKENDLNKIRASAKYLLSLDTKKLETLMLGVLDVLSFRLDAWITALATLRLYECRQKSQPASKHSAHGVYGWLEKPGVKLTNATASFKYEYIQAPSLKQAATAALLKNAANNSNFKFNLNAEQVQKGLYYFDMLKKGYTSSEILGYQLERIIHKEALNHQLIEDMDIYALREVFSLSHQNNITTLIDGKKFIDNFDLLPASFSAQKKIQYGLIRNKLQEILDAAADIAVSESMHQIMKGNTARTAAWMDFMEGKVYPPDIEFLSTQRTGKVFNTSVHLLLPENNSINSNAPLYQANPEIAQFCETVLKNDLTQPLKILTREKNSTVFTETIDTNIISQLNLQAIDFVLMKPEWLIEQIRYYLNADQNLEIKLETRNNLLLQKAEKIKRLIRSTQKDPSIFTNIHFEKTLNLAKDRLDNIIQLLETLDPTQPLHFHHLATIGFPEVYQEDQIDHINIALTNRIQKLNELQNNENEQTLIKINQAIAIAIGNEDTIIITPYISEIPWENQLDYTEPNPEHHPRITFVAEDYQNVRPHVSDLINLCSHTDYVLHISQSDKNNDVYFTSNTSPLRQTSLVCLLIDQWSEMIPLQEETTGIAMHYPAPKSEAPNAILIAVPITLDNNQWLPEELADTLASTLSLMRMRLVTNDQIQQNSNLAAQLPLSIIGLTKDEQHLFPTMPRALINAVDLQPYVYFPIEEGGAQ